MYGPCYFPLVEDSRSQESQDVVVNDIQKTHKNSMLACRVTEAVLAAAIGVSISDMRKPSRHYARAAFARHMAFYLLHVGFGLDFSTIGRSMGRNRTTIQYACSRVEDARDEEIFDVGLECLETALVALHETLQTTLFSKKKGCLDEQKYNFQATLHAHSISSTCLYRSTFSVSIG